MPGGTSALRDSPLMFSVIMSNLAGMAVARDVLAACCA
jgi:hypothetical protein